MAAACAVTRARTPTALDTYALALELALSLLQDDPAFDIDQFEQTAVFTQVRGPFPAQMTFPYRVVLARYFMRRHVIRRTSDEDFAWRLSLVSYPPETGDPPLVVRTATARFFQSIIDMVKSGQLSAASGAHILDQLYEITVLAPDG